MVPESEGIMKRLRLRRCRGLPGSRAALTTEAGWAAGFARLRRLAGTLATSRGPVRTSAVRFWLAEEPACRTCGAVASELDHIRRPSECGAFFDRATFSRFAAPVTLAVPAGKGRWPSSGSTIGPDELALLDESIGERDISQPNGPDGCLSGSRRKETTMRRALLATVVIASLLPLGGKAASAVVHGPGVVIISATERHEV
jgi:hypothetical protein